MNTAVITALIGAAATIISIVVNLIINSRSAKTTTFTATMDGMQKLLDEYKEQAKEDNDRHDRRQAELSRQVLELTAQVNRCEAEKDTMRREFVQEKTLMRAEFTTALAELRRGQ